MKERKKRNMKWRGRRKRMSLGSKGMKERKEGTIAKGR